MINIAALAAVLLPMVLIGAALDPIRTTTTTTTTEGTDQ